MKRLPILFSIVLLVVLGVNAQEKAKGIVPVDHSKLPTVSVPPEICNRTAPPVTPGNFPSVPDSIMKASLVKRDGTVFTLEEYRGTVVLLHLWATWLGPAIPEVPRLNEIQEEYRASGLKVIGLNIGDGNESPTDGKEIAQFAKRRQVKYELAQEVNVGVLANTMYALTQFSGVPQTILIDREGKIRGLFLGGGQKVSLKRKEVIDKLMSEK